MKKSTSHYRQPDQIATWRLDIGRMFAGGRTALALVVVDEFHHLVGGDDLRRSSAKFIRWAADRHVPFIISENGGPLARGRIERPLRSLGTQGPGLPGSRKRPKR